MPFAFPLLVDSSYSDAYAYIPILAISIYYTNMSNFFGGIFGAYKDTKIMGSTTIVAAIMNIVINLIFKFGIWAAVFSTLISNVVIYWYRRQKLKMYINLKGKFNYAFWLLLGLTLFTYYKNNMAINIVMFIIVLAYCIFTNKNFINQILSPITKRLKKSK